MEDILLYNVLCVCVVRVALKAYEKTARMKRNSLFMWMYVVLNDICCVT